MDLITVEYFYDTIYFDACEDKAGNFNLMDIAKEFLGITKGIFFNLYATSYHFPSNYHGDCFNVLLGDTWCPPAPPPSQKQLPSPLTSAQLSVKWVKFTS